MNNKTTIQIQCPKCHGISTKTVDIKNSTFVYKCNNLDDVDDERCNFDLVVNVEFEPVITLYRMEEIKK